MKKLHLLTILLFSVTSVAQNKVNLNGLLQLEAMNTAVCSQGISVETERIEALVLMNDNWKQQTLEKYQVEIVTEISNNLLVADIPADVVVPFSEEPDVKYVEFGNEYNVTLDMARPTCNVNKIQDGFRYNGQTIRFDGSGIVTGLMDSGLDPNHPMFLDANGESRVKAAYDFNNKITATTPSEIKTFTSDDVNSTHGTHVAGIMAGKSYLTGDYCTTLSPTSGPLSTYNGKIPFYGIATGSDIVMTSGTFTTSNIAKGAKAVAEYAEKNGQPFVLNISLANNNGPHDGTGLLESTFSEIASKGIVCVASGNEGSYKIFAGKKFTSTDNTMKTFIAGNKFKGIDLWSNDERPLTVTISFYGNGAETPLARITQAGQEAKPADRFSDYMDGNITMRSEVNGLNNRFHVSMTGSFTQKAAGLNVMVTVSGAEGQEVYCYGQGQTSFASDGIDGFTDGSCNGSVNGLATAKNVIAVGSVTTRNAWGTFAGVYTYSKINDYPVGKVSPFTGYGYRFDETPLPTVCAPGAMIQSSINRYYTNRLSSAELSKMCAKVNDGNMTAYWGESNGTSMAAPFMAGTIALWLQADPTLKYDDIVSILKKTSLNPLGYNATEDEKVRWGAGRLDALAGLKEVLARKAAGVQGVISDNNEAIVTMTGNRSINISVASASSITASLFNIQGIQVATAQSDASEITLTADNVPSGVYILKVATPLGKTTTRRLLLK